MMKKKLTALVLMAALVLSMAACSSEPESTDPVTGTTTATPATTTKRPSVELPPEETGDPDDWTDITNLFIPYGSVTVDGVKDEAWANAATVTLDQVKKDTPNADTVVSASALWDENGLHFLFEITDSDIYQSGAVGDYNNDGIYLYVSEDPESFVSSFDAFANGVYQFALINKDLEMLPRKGIDTTVDIKPQSAYTITETGMIIEFSYTPYYTPVVAGNFLLIDYQYNDCTSSGTRSGGMGWYNGTDTNASPSMWGIAKLLAKGEAAPDLD